MAPPRSNVWKHFKKITPNTAKCSLCGKVLKTSGNTINLKTHLKQKHSFVLQYLTEWEKEVGEPKKRKGPSHPESRMDLETARTSSALPQSGENLIASQESDSTSTMTVSEYEAEPSTSTEITSSLFKQATIVSAFKTISSFKDGGSKNVKLTEALVKFVVQDNLPFNKM
ncbi:BED zinc finger [Popillia japonica]|uniref:BED zinc finger n=1 Tax=Popillia japonica TaxID=7064 RepID=A0AAW1MG99_POPJA